jgi:hypothetical protein
MLSKGNGEKHRDRSDVFVSLSISLEATSKNIQERLMKSIKEYGDQLEKEKGKMREMAVEIEGKSD